MLVTILCACTSILYSQTNKDLNSPERVTALYKISMQHKELTKQVKECQSRYNTEMQAYEKSFEQIKSLAIALGEESSAFVSHNLDLQEGLLGSLKKQEQQEIELAKLKAKRTRRFGVGAYGGYDLLNSVPSVGISLNYNLFYLF
jgi:hypothetical protein